MQFIEGRKWQRNEVTSWKLELFESLRSSPFSGSGIRELDRLRKMYGHGNWRKMKGITRIRLPSGRIRLAELHWYEAHGIGKKEIKRKKYLE